ncbi:hypothetical protein [Pedobacter duraquae]|nr:hypothetical protein [Pedobacter duraquae]
MAENKDYQVLELVVSVLQESIADSKVQKESENTSVLKDGNDFIRLEQEFDGDTAVILITDKKDIIYSEDLLETLLRIQKNEAPASFIINGLNVEAELVLYAVRDHFDEASSSYEFVRAVERKVQEMKIRLKFGDHLFEVVVVNGVDRISVSPIFDKPLDAAVQSAIEADAVRVQAGINKQFKGK